MSNERRFRPRVEPLEDRLALSGDVGEGPAPPTNEDPSEIITPIDPTEDPVDPGNITIEATITAVGPVSNGSTQSITVTGIAPGSLAFGDVRVQIGDNVYDVDFVAANNDGSYRLTVANGIAMTDVSIGAEVLIIFGDGGLDPLDPTTEPEAPPEEVPPFLPPIDPTADPVG